MAAHSSKSGSARVPGSTGLQGIAALLTMSLDLHPMRPAAATATSPPLATVTTMPAGTPTREWLMTLVPAWPAPMFVKDSQCRYLAVNAPYAALFDRRPSDLVGLRDDDLMEPLAAQASARRDARVIADREAINGPFCIHALGAGPLCRMSSLRALSVGEQGFGLLGWLDEPDAGNPNWEARERQLLTQISHLAHDLRSPLAGIVGLAGLMRADTPPNPKHLEWLDIIESSGLHVISTINDLVEVGLISTGQVILRPEPVDLYGMLKELTDWVRPHLRNDGVALTASLQGFDGTAPAPRVKVDAKRLRQLLLNLLFNAARVTTAGEISLQCRRVDRASTNRASAHLRFEVKDSGPGILANRLKELFSHGSALELWSEVRSERRGGLGILISRRLACAMGGELEVSSQEGRGTAFWFEIEAPLLNRGDPGASL